MKNAHGEYINGYIERKNGGIYDGTLLVDSINLSPITAVFFKQEGKTYLWLRRKDMLVYNEERQEYVTKKREPRWEAYLEKRMDAGSTVAYKGEFYFLMFKYEITGVWDANLGKDNGRLNLFVERVPMERQDIINGIRRRNKNL